MKGSLLLDSSKENTENRPYDLRSKGKICGNSPVKKLPIKNTSADESATESTSSNTESSSTESSDSVPVRPAKKRSVDPDFGTRVVKPSIKNIYSDESSTESTSSDPVVNVTVGRYSKRGPYTRNRKPRSDKGRKHAYPSNTKPHSDKGRKRGPHSDDRRLAISNGLRAYHDRRRLETQEPTVTIRVEIPSLSEVSDVAYEAMPSYAEL